MPGWFRRDHGVASQATAQPPASTTDTPSVDDLLGVDPYIDALVRFVDTCHRPMTIAVQGDWGSGKTSLIHLVLDRLERDHDADVVTVETWRLAQFDQSGSIALNVIETVTHAVTQDDPDARAALDTLLVALRAGAGMAFDLAAGAAGATIGGWSRDLLQATRAAAVEEFRDTPAETIERLRTDFRTAVARRQARTGRRPVIVVDDLDRLEPARAVEVMEGLKTILESPDLVFVLAIDFDVVAEGVRARYGATMDEAKTRAYFDKMIQVPFELPVGVYRVGPLLERALGDADQHDVDAAALTDLAQFSVARNPRALKRLVNSFALLRTIAEAQLPDPTTAQRGLFALLALQAAHPGYRSRMQLAGAAAVRSGLLDHAVLLESAPDGLDAESRAEALTRWQVAETDAVDLARLLRAVHDALPADPDALARLLTITSVTSVRTGGPAASSGGPRRLDLDDRLEATRRLGVPEATLDTAAALERAVADALPGGRDTLQGALAPEKRQWVWYAGEGRGRLAELYFARDRLNVYFGSRGWPEAERVDLEPRIRELADRHGWEFSLGPSGTLFRLRGVAGSSGDPAPTDHALTDLASVLARCSALSRP